MTVISALTASGTSSAPNQASTLLQQQAAAQQAQAGQASTASTQHPTDTVSTSSAVASAASTPPSIGSADPNAVEDTLYDVSGANGFAFIFAHTNYSAQQYGQATATRDNDSLRNAVFQSGGLAEAAASSLGISVTSSVSSTSAANGADPGTLSVANFSFTNGGSTYSVTNGANGSLIGTKDGQAWLNLQLGAPTGDQYSNVATPKSVSQSIATELLDVATGAAKPGYASPSSINLAA
jgi:hypothetical protein